MKKTIIFQTLILFILAELFVSCSNAGKEEYISFYNFGHEGIEPSCEYLFYPFKEGVADTTAASYNLSLIVRYSDKCEAKSLPLKVEIMSLEKEKALLLNPEIPLFDTKGKVSGKGNFLIYESEIPLLDNQKFEEGLSLSVSSESETLLGIISLGVKCINNYLP